MKRGCVYIWRGRDCIFSKQQVLSFAQEMEGARQMGALGMSHSSTEQPRCPVSVSSDGRSALRVPSAACPELLRTTLPSKALLPHLASWPLSFTVSDRPPRRPFILPGHLPQDSLCISHLALGSASQRAQTNGIICGEDRRRQTGVGVGVRMECCIIFFHFRKSVHNAWMSIMGGKHSRLSTWFRNEEDSDRNKQNH